MVQVFFGLHYLAAKIVLLEIPPRAWALLRVSGAAVLLLATVRVLNRRLPRSRRDVGLLALFSVFGVVINQVCFVEGLSRTTPTHASLIMTMIPVLTLLFSILAGRERLEIRKLLAAAIAFAGVVLIIRPTAWGVESTMIVGDLLTLINASSYALFLVFSKKLLERVDALSATALLFAFGSVLIALLGLPQLLALELGAVSPQVWALGAFIVLFPTAGAYLISYWALARLESSVVAFFIYLQPVIATGLSILLLGDRPTATVWIGGSLIFAGVYLALRRRTVQSTAVG